MGFIYLIRHGVTDLNPDYYQGVKDNRGLNNQGKKQALKMSVFFKNQNIKLDKIFSSKLKRSLETGKILLSNISMDNLSFESNSLLNEINFGLFDGVKKAEVLLKYDWFFKDNPYGFYTFFDKKFVDGESMAEVYSRVDLFFEQFQMDPNQNYVIIGHNGINRLIRHYFNPKPLFITMKNNQSHEEVIVINLKTKEEKIISYDE